MTISVARHQFPPTIIRHAVWPDLNTWFLQWIDWIGVSAKFNLAWHYAWGGRGGFERIWTGPAAGVGA